MMEEIKREILECLSNIENLAEYLHELEDEVFGLVEDVEEINDQLIDAVNDINWFALELVKLNLKYRLGLNE